MQLMTPTPMKAVRQARSASPSSERRTPGAAAIYPDLVMKGLAIVLLSGGVDRKQYYRFSPFASNEVTLT
jgi:hypothetical protein